VDDLLRMMGRRRTYGVCRIGCRSLGTDLHCEFKGDTTGGKDGEVRTNEW
jgi:hypothetical protein